MTMSLQIAITGNYTLSVNLAHVKDFDNVLYKRIVCYPAVS